jgi:hypothetical protein
MAAAREQLTRDDARAAFAHLERTHGQMRFGRHLRVHLRMLRTAWMLRDGREVRGQLLRIVLTPIGHLTGRLPLGNTGTSKVSAFAPMPIPPELRRLLDDPKSVVWTA